MNKDRKFTVMFKDEYGENHLLDNVYIHPELRPSVDVKDDLKDCISKLVICGNIELDAQILWQLPALTKLKVRGAHIINSKYLAYPILKSVQIHVTTIERPSTVLKHIIDSCVHLHKLHITSCKLNGEIPHTLSNLSRLKSLSLHNNKLTGTITPDYIPSSVTLLDLTYNQLDIDRDIKTKLTNIDEVRLYHQYMKEREYTSSLHVEYSIHT